MNNTHQHKHPMLSIFIFCICVSSYVLPPVSSNADLHSATTSGCANGLRNEKELRDLVLTAETRLERCRADVRRAADDLRKRELQANRIKLQLRNKVVLAERKEMEAIKARKLADEARAESEAIQAESSACIAGASSCKNNLDILINEAKTAEAAVVSIKQELHQHTLSNRVNVRSVGHSRLSCQPSRIACKVGVTQAAEQRKATAEQRKGRVFNSSTSLLQHKIGATRRVASVLSSEPANSYTTAASKRIARHVGTSSAVNQQSGTAHELQMRIQSWCENSKTSAAAVPWSLLARAVFVSVPRALRVPLLLPPYSPSPPPPSPLALPLALPLTPAPPTPPVGEFSTCNPWPPTCYPRSTASHVRHQPVDST
jgi:hypothetical protein